MKKALPVGYEDIREIIDKKRYYVDKTMMIKSLLDSGGKVNLFTRPRRFGKTLNMSMIRRFFELEIDSKGNKISNAYIFEHLKISSCGEEYMSKQGRFPVINLSLKSTKQPSFDLAYGMLNRQIGKEFSRHQYVLQGDALSETEKNRFRKIMEEEKDPLLYPDSLQFLSECLARYHGVNTIILIDEYDVPLENAWTKGFYDEMTAFVRSLFESALKTNLYLEFAVITGCLRISRESIFTGLNNLKIYSMLYPGFEDSFGFTEDEVKEMLAYYDLDKKYDEIKKWYDGYRFGRMDIYNPWSIISYVDVLSQNPQAFPACYWSNTSSNDIIKELVEGADLATRSELEELIAGGTIEKPIHEDVTYDDIHESKDNLWNFLFFTGYLKKTDEYFRDDVTYLRLAIPNAEVRTIYRTTILSWFDRKAGRTDLRPLIHAMEIGDCRKIEDIISEKLLETVSFYDYAENYYHGFLTGLLKNSESYTVSSNPESGRGRPDIVLRSNKVRGGIAMILELKAVHSVTGMDEGCVRAVRQIEEKNYEAALKNEGYENIKKYGICFCKKECRVMEG